jgi:hypothetical protein
MVSIRQFSTPPPAANSGLELRIGGSSALRARSSVPGDSPLQIASAGRQSFSGSLLALVGTQGRMPESDLLAIEQTLQRALQSAGFVP